MRKDLSKFPHSIKHLSKFPHLQNLDKKIRILIKYFHVTIVQFKQLGKEPLMMCHSQKWRSLAFFLSSHKPFPLADNFVPCHLYSTTMLILTPDQIMRKGLELCGYDLKRQQRVKRETNLERFKDSYGSHPVVYAQIFEDLQTTDIDEAKVEGKKLNLTYFLAGLHWLKRYPTEKTRSGRFKVCETTARNWGWFYAKKIQALKTVKVSCLLLFYIIFSCKNKK